MFKRPVNSLAVKLIVAIGTLMTAGGMLFGYLFIQYEEHVMMNGLLRHATSTADLVKRGLNLGMLTSHRKTIEQTIEVVGQDSEIKSIWVSDKNGKVIYSSDSSGLGRIIDKSSRECKVCHADNVLPRQTLAESKSWEIAGRGWGPRTLNLVTPVYNEPSCFTAACHYHPKEQKVLGIIGTNFSTSVVDSAMKQHRIRIILLGGLFIITISGVLWFILYKLVSRPVSLLDKGMQRLAKGDLNYIITINSEDEMGRLAKTFNIMAEDIKRYTENMENWTKALEEEIQKKTSEIMKAHDQLINAEKLASLGRMAAGVAHELNSPLTGIVTFAHLLLKRLPPENKQDIEDLRVIIEQSDRCSKIIKGLLGFSRKATSEKALVDINSLTENTISMVRNQAKFYNIKFSLDFDNSIPQIATDPNQLQQVFINLLINAADAMNERGQITVSTGIVSELPSGKRYIEIEFTDTGPGISEENIGKVFEPFFTTKPIGKGTGLGLAVSYGIVKKHGGNIFVRSETGKGASFFVRLPVEGPETEFVLSADDIREGKGERNDS